MANNRIYYAIQQVRLGNPGVTVHGLQSVGVSTNFNLEQVFELGQLSLYQNVENVPEIEVTLNKVLDGYAPLYILATEAGTKVDPAAVADNATLPGRAKGRVDMELSIYPDTLTSASGNSISLLNCDGMYVSSVSYTFPADGNFTEDVTLVGNDKLWKGTTVTGAFPNNDDEPAAIEGVQRRQHLDMANSRFPKELVGDGEVNILLGNGSGYTSHFQNITVSCDLGREAILELGTFVPYHRYVNFPVEVTCEFEVIQTSGDGINATESGYWVGESTYGGSTSVAGAGDSGCGVNRFNLRDQKIIIASCDGLTLDLGEKNKLNSVNYTGGDTGGGNVTVTYSYSNFNDFTVTHPSGAF